MVKGCRVELHPGTDLWMMGARYGTVMGAAKGDDGRDMVWVKLDKLALPRLVA